MSETLFVSTAIPYVNARPHVGFALEIVQADAIARYFRLIGYDNFFLTGTDENTVGELRSLAYWLEPFMPATAARLRESLFGEKPLTRGVPLFPRLKQ